MAIPSINAWDFGKTIQWTVVVVVSANARALE